MSDYSVMGAGDLEGFQQHRESRRKEAVASATALWADLIGGRVPSYFLQEALAPRTPAVAALISRNYPGIFRETMTTSDFPYLTGDVIDRMLLARYRDFPSGWRQFCSVKTTLRDFRTVRRLGLNGAEGLWSSVPEESEFEYTSVSEANYTYAPLKYAQGLKISFEALMSDDLDAFTSLPDRLGRGGARTVAKFVTELYVDSSGPHASLYDAGYNNIVTANPALSMTALQTAWGILRGQTDSNGQPIMVEAAILVVPPALEVTARNILNAIQIDMTNAGGISGQTLTVQNWMVGGLSLVVDPYIPIVASSSNGSTSWFLFASPSVSRPALEVGFITGFSEPQLYQKLANTIRIGGGVDQMAGDWASMSQEYKGVLAFGGTRLDPKATVGSEGDGS